MTALQHRMIEDLHLRGMSERTQGLYVRVVRQLAEHSQKSPASITEEAQRQSFLALKHVKHVSRSASTLALCGRTFFYEHPLPRAWPTLTFVRPPQEHTLPVILCMEAVYPRLPCVRFLRSRVCLNTLYSCGLRLHEGTHLQVPARDRARRLVPVRCGPGAQARSVPLPQRPLVFLRHSWATHRHPGGRFPAPGRRGLGMPTATAPMPRHSVQDALRAALRDSGIHQRAPCTPCATPGPHTCAKRGSIATAHPSLSRTPRACHHSDLYPPDRHSGRHGPCGHHEPHGGAVMVAGADSFRLDGPQ